MQLTIGRLALVCVAQAAAQVSYLQSTKSGVVPVAPTPFPSGGFETIEGALVYDGPPLEGFTGPGGNASIQSGIPTTSYEAVLPATNFDDATGSLITGSIVGMSNGTGVMFTVNFTGFPSESQYGPFVYHVHGLPVPADGNCTATLGHLDPTNRGELHACENAAPQTCQAGDLSGKHGNITATSFTASYLELYLSTDPSSPYFFGDKSIVIHSMNATRLTCANFTMMASGGTNTTSGSNSSTTTVPGGASNVAVRLGTSGSIIGLVIILVALVI